MNRRKKIYTKLKAKDKKANQRLNGKKKPKYISKAERAELEAQQAADKRVDENLDAFIGE